MRNKLFLVFLLFIFTTLVYAQFTENFDGAVFPPADWVANGVTRVSTAPQSAPYCIEFDATSDALITPLLVNPGIMSYYHKKGTGNYQFYLQYSSSQSGPWTTVPGYPIFAGNGWTQKTEDLSAYSYIYLRWIPQTSPPGAKIFFVDTIGVTPGAPVPPSEPPIEVTFPYVGVYQMNISWTRGDGEYCVAFLHQGPGMPLPPVDGTDYIPSTDWNLPGTQLGASGYYCIYNGTGNSVTVSNLLPVTNYWVVVYEYNGYGLTSIYLITGAEGNATTLDPTVPVTLSSFTAQLTHQRFVDIRWTTQSETDAMGFNIFRNHTATLSSSYLVNPYMIPATNTSVETNYNFLDEEATPGTWFYWLENKNINGVTDYYGPISITITDGTNSTVVPEVTSLIKLFPNPFNPEILSLSGRYELSKAENVNVAIYNLRGQKVKTLASGVRNAGAYPFTWDGRDDKGDACSTGIYYLMMTSSGYSTSRKFMLIR
jgi:hypothetical protein